MNCGCETKPMQGTGSSGGDASHGDCGCGGHEKKQGGCGCGGAKAGTPQGFDFGQRFCLDSSVDDSTATDPIPMGGGSAIEVCLTIFSQSGAASLDVVVLGAVLENFHTVTTQTITGGVGYYSFSVTGLVWNEFKLGLRAHSGSIPVVFSLYAFVSCA